MPTNAELGAKLLSDAAGFFRQVGEQNPAVKEQMEQNADMYQQVANMVATDPTGELPQPPQGNPDASGQ